MIYFTSDQHFDHHNIIQYCKRPFNNVRQMNRRIINEYNNIITEKDTVYIIGDLTLYGPTQKGAVEQFVNKLHGKKHLILGNHDRLSPQQYLDTGILSVHTSLEINSFILVHDPAVSAIDRSKIFLCGHVHDLFKIAKNVINIGVDVWDFKPVSLEQIEKTIKENSVKGELNE